MEKKHKRPISPHLQVYNIFSKDMTSGPSFLNRFTRSGLTFGSIYVIAWLVCAGLGENYYDMFLKFITSWFGYLSLAGFSFCYGYYVINGARFLTFDLGFWLSRAGVLRSGRIMALLVVLFLVVTWGYVILEKINY